MIDTQCLATRLLQPGLLSGSNGLLESASVLWNMREFAPDRTTGSLSMNFLFVNARHWPNDAWDASG